MNGIPFSAFIDLGNDCSLIRHRDFQKIGKPMTPCSVILNGFAGNSCESLEKCQLDVTVDDVCNSIDVIIVQNETMNYPVIYGKNFIDRPGVKLTKEYGSLLIERVKSAALLSITETELNLNTNLSSDHKQRLLLLVASFRGCFAKQLNK